MEFYGRPSVNTIRRYHSSRRPVIYFGKVSFDPDTCDHSMIGGRLFGKWCIRDDIGKVGGCVPLDISNAEIPNDVVKGGRRLPPNDVAKAIFDNIVRRSEEHTSELQSHLNLVCRLLLEKKKKT